MRYAVTGSNGLVGSALTRSLAAQGHEVVALYRSGIPKDFYSLENVIATQARVEDLPTLLDAFEGVDGVFHVAAFARPWAPDESIYFNVNERGTENVCTAALKQGVKRVVYTASAGIHGAQLGETFVDETHWPEQYFTAYEQSKYNGMQTALGFIDRGLEVTVVSPARVYGPGHDSASNVPVRMMKIYMKQGFGVAPSTGQGIGSYAFIDDIVEGHILAMTKAPAGEEYLLGGINVDYITFFEQLAELSGKKRPIVKVPYQLSLGIGKTQQFLAEQFGVTPTITAPWVRKYLKHWGVDSSKIQQLGYGITPLQEGMEHVLKQL